MFCFTVEDMAGATVDRFTFEAGDFIVGRHESSDLVIDSRSVSRNHARIFVKAGTCFIEDLNSANGVVVDGQKLRGQRPLSKASQIKIGDYFLYFQIRNEGPVGADMQQTVFIPSDSDDLKLVRINDKYAGEEFFLTERDNSIGRGDENLILLSDTSISRRHAQIIRERSTYELIDLGSSNGTKLNGRRVKKQATLTIGDRVKFGSIEFVLVHGFHQVSFSDYNRSKFSREWLLAAGGIAGVLLLVFLLSMYIGDTTQSTEDSAKQARIADQFALGEEHARRRQWSNALAKLEWVLREDPNHDRAQTLHKTAAKEIETDRQLEEAEKLMGDGNHREARDTLAALPSSSSAYGRAQKLLNHINRAIAHEDKNAGLRDSLSHDPNRLVKAQLLLCKSLKFDPEDQETNEAIDKIEERMRSMNLSFNPCRR
jgi:ABC transport system ATP-binding/permease protein